MTAIDVLKNSTIEGNVVTLPPGKLDRKLYEEVAKKITGIGGKWNRKAEGFVFDSDPRMLFSRILDGESVNLKKDFEFFATPEELADFAYRQLKLGDHMRVLEPSAGQGALIDAMMKNGDQWNTCSIFYIEKMLENRFVLEKKYKRITNVYNLHPKNDDFLECDLTVKPDRIFANPPFSKNQDIDHVYKMWEVLAPAGRIVTFTSPHWTFVNNRKETDFRKWLEDKKHTVTTIDGGSFKASGTMIETRLLVIDKP